MSEISPTPTRIALLEKRALTPSLFLLTFERPDNYPFLPGQFARLGLTLVPDKAPECRAYSIASAPSEKVLRFLVKRVEGGVVSPRLVSLEVGDTVILEGDAQGNLLPERLPGGEVMWYIATGAGLAPFLSIMKHNEETGKENRQEVLVVGARTVEEVNALITLAREHASGIQIVGAASGEAHTLTGRLPELLASGQLEAHTERTIEKSTSRVMLCGNPDCMKALRAHFKTREIIAPRFGAPGELLVESLW